LLRTSAQARNPNAIKEILSIPGCLEGSSNLVPSGFVQNCLNLWGSARRRPPQFKASDIIAALTFHVLMGRGTIEEHFQQMLGRSPSGAAISQRRERLAYAIFEAVPCAWVEGETVRPLSS